MTNEQYAAFIHEGGNDELIPLLWERIRRLMYSKSTKFYISRKSLCDRCGVTLDDIKQECYPAFLDALRAYTGEQQCKFISFLSYPFQNRTNALTGQRTASGRAEPLNHSASLDEPLTNAEGDTDTSRLDLLPDEAAEEAYSEVEQTEIQRIVRQEVDRLGERERFIVLAYYYDNQPMKAIAESLTISLERVRQILAHALRELRKSRTLRQLHREFSRHYEWNRFSHFEYSPDYFDLVQKLQERERQGEYLSYGNKQAALYSFRRKYEQEHSEALI